MQKERACLDCRASGHYCPSVGMGKFCAACSSTQECEFKRQARESGISLEEAGRIQSLEIEAKIRHCTRCQKKLRSDNSSGRCWDHKYVKVALRVPEVEMRSRA